MSEHDEKRSVAMHEKWLSFEKIENKNTECPVCNNDYSACEYIPTSGNCGAVGNESSVTWNFDTATGTLTISGGTINISSTDDAIHSNADLSVNGGTIRMFFKSVKTGEFYCYKTFVGPVSLKFSKKEPDIAVWLNTTQNKTTYVIPIGADYVDIPVRVMSSVIDNYGYLTAFEKKYPNFQKNEDYQARLADTVSKENIAKAMPYVAEDGKVMIVVNIYALAGAAYYPEVIPLS